MKKQKIENFQDVTSEETLSLRDYPRSVSDLPNAVIARDSSQHHQTKQSPLFNNSVIARDSSQQYQAKQSSSSTQYSIPQTSNPVFSEDVTSDQTSQATAEIKFSLFTPVVYFYTWDHLGTVRLITNSTCAIVSKHNFEPYGVELPLYNETANNTHKFTGQERDASTGYDYMHFRFYASSIGRFLKPDNIIPDITNPQNWNAYTYVKGNPINFNDPSGHLDERDYSTAGSSESGIALDNGEPPSLGGWADDIGDTVSNTKYQLMKAGFSKKAVERAVKEGNLKPIIKTYVVHGGGKYGGNVAISATLGGESIWWSHGGDASLYGRMNAEESEKYFLSIYLNKKETIDVFTLNLSLEESVRVASEINKRIDYSEIPATAKKQYEFKPEILYVCTTSTSEILFQAGIVSIIMPLKSVPFVYWPNTSKKVYESLSEKHETFIPSN